MSPRNKFDWECHPEAEALVDGLVSAALADCPFAADLAERMRLEASLRFVDLVDHFVVNDRPGFVADLESAGFRREVENDYEAGIPTFALEAGTFPRIAVRPDSGGNPTVHEVAVKVESVSAFSRAHDLGAPPVGPPLGPYRLLRLAVSPTSFAAVERHGYLGFEPYSGAMSRRGRMTPQATRDAMTALDLWTTRKRRFVDDGEGFDVADEVLDRVIERCEGATDLACDLVFRAERDYWESRNRAARVQKARQDRLGLGWANHDHHTFRCSRRYFPRVVAILERLGFTLRERFHVGDHAGWGAQILEHPTTGIVVFADLDLAPDEVSEDFAHLSLPDLSKPNTVGLWVGLHGESLLGAGMHHLEAQFDFDALRDDLRAEAGIETMPPFSDFPFLRQAFSKGEIWKVDPRRADRLLELGWIDADQHARFVAEGALGSHLENLQRGGGFKGFNQKSVSVIIAETDPRRLQAAR